MTDAEHKQLSEDLARALGWKLEQAIWWPPSGGLLWRREAPAYDSPEQVKACMEFQASGGICFELTRLADGHFHACLDFLWPSEGATWTEALARATIAAAGGRVSEA